MTSATQSGGKGTHLRLHMIILPKPLTPVSAKPVLERLLKWFGRNGTEEALLPRAIPASDSELRWRRRPLELADQNYPGEGIAWRRWGGEPAAHRDGRHRPDAERGRPGSS